jgi:Ca2+-transporting ATPase
VAPTRSFPCLVNQSIAISSAAFEDIDPEAKVLTFIRSKTETALLQFTKDLDWEDWNEIREAAKVVHMVPRRAYSFVFSVFVGL